MIDPSTTSSHEAVEVARWTHIWFISAVLVLAQLEETWDDDVIRSIAKRDVLAHPLVNAVRNVYRGSRAVLPDSHQEVQSFESALPQFKELRDRLEHFEDYVRGRGHAQSPEDADHSNPLRLSSSTGGSREGHVVVWRTQEKGQAVDRRFPTRTAIASARQLVLAVLGAVGLDDERHQSCPWCRPDGAPEGPLTSTYGVHLEP